MSVFERGGQLSEEQKNSLREVILDKAKRSVDGQLTPDEVKEETPEGEALKRATDVFFDLVAQKAADRKFFTADERSCAMEEIEKALTPFFASLEQQDLDRLETFAESEPQTLGQTFEAMSDDLHAIEEELLHDQTLGEGEEGKLTEEQRADLVEDREYVHAQRQDIIDAVRRGAKLTDYITKDERDVAVDALRSRVATLPPLAEQSSQVAKDMVDAYDQLLVAHKISLGLEAHYDDAEILKHLESVMPSEVAADVKAELQRLRTEREKSGGHKVTAVEVYGRVMSLLIKKQPARAIGMTAGTVLIGYLAPQMGARLGAFAQNHDPKELLAGAGYQFAGLLAQTELSRHLSRFVGGGLYGEQGIAGDFTKALIGSSPEFFTRQDQSFVRSEVEASLAGIDRAAEATFEGVGSRLARVLALGAASASRIGNPLLFGPVVAAVGWNVYVAMKEGKKLGEADYHMRQASTEFLKEFDEAAQVKVSRGAEQGMTNQVSQRLEESRKRFADASARYRRMSEAVMPAMIVANAMLIDQADPNFMGHFVEATTYSTQLSMELTELIKQVTSMQRALKPIVDLINTVDQFKENGATPPSNWNVDMADVRLGPLTVPELQIAPGDFVTVVGESGSGKSTLMKLLYGFKPDRGLVEIDGTMASRIDKRAYRQEVAVSNQFYTVETKSFRENVIGELPYQEDVFKRLLSEHGFEVFFAKQKKGPNDLILNTDTKLSGGEKKLLSLLAMDYRLTVAPESIKMILLDEPTSGVDHRQKKKLFAMVQRWRSEHPNITMVTVNHDPDWFDHLADDSRVLGIGQNGVLSQNETLAEARLHSGAPFHDLFATEK